MVVEVVKRDGRVVPFDKKRISSAIVRAALAVSSDVDESIANDLTDCVVWYLNGRFDKANPPNVEQIQDAVEKILIENGHAATAKAYILYRAERSRTREMSTALMKTYEDLTFKYSKDMDSKRENANINTDTAMGTMLKYGSEGAKKFNHLYLLDKDVSEAHLDGDIHIHDLDFYSLTETCITEDMELKFWYDGAIDISPVKVLDDYLDVVPIGVPLDVSDKELYVRGDLSWTKVLNIVRHKAENKKVLKIKTQDSVLCVTDEHRIPVIKVGNSPYIRKDFDADAERIAEDCEYLSLDVKASDLKEGMIVRVISSISQKESFAFIEGISEVNYSGDYVYDLETEEHYFRANGILVHNCCQIDIEKLFTDGFSTGHGYLREPNSIQSYSALACIAIQSNQNDQHKCVAYME